MQNVSRSEIQYWQDNLLSTNLIYEKVKGTMKKSLTEYASVLSGSSINCLEEIVGKKYKKFIRFYAILKDQSEYIKKMEYEFTDIDQLAVSVTFTKNVSLDDKKDLISDMKKAGYKIDSKITGKKVKLKITYKEN